MRVITASGVTHATCVMHHSSTAAWCIHLLGWMGAVCLYGWLAVVAQLFVASTAAAVFCRDYNSPIFFLAIYLHTMLKHSVARFDGGVAWVELRTASCIGHCPCNLQCCCCCLRSGFLCHAGSLGLPAGFCPLVSVDCVVFTQHAHHHHLWRTYLSSAHAVSAGIQLQP